MAPGSVISGGESMKKGLKEKSEQIAVAGELASRVSCRVWDKGRRASEREADGRVREVL